MELTPKDGRESRSLTAETDAGGITASLDGAKAAGKLSSCLTFLRISGLFSAGEGGFLGEDWVDIDATVEETVFF